MSFSVVFISLLCIGSSIAANDMDRLKSFRLLNSHINTYVIELSKIYNGFQALQASAQYIEFKTQDDTIYNEESKRYNNLTFQTSRYAIQPITLYDTVIENWRTDAINVINECTNSADQFILNEQNEGRYVLFSVWEQIVNTTNVTWTAINQDENIIDEQKGESCPIYAKLVAVINAYTPQQPAN